MDGPPRKLPPKREVLLALLSEGGVYVHLDPRRPGVLVPKWFQNQAELILQLGLNMSIPIPDLEVDDEGVTCTLSFNRAPFWCKLPWNAIFALVSEKDRRGIVWPEDVPPESTLSRGSSPPTSKPARPKLTALGPNDRLEPEPESGDTLAGSLDDLEGERPPAPEGAQCSGCATRWAEDQTTCPVCGSTDYVVPGGAAAATPAGAPDSTGPARDEAPAPALAPAPRRIGAAPSKTQRPTLVEGGASDKKRTAPRVKAKPRPTKKGRGAPASPRTLGLVPPEGSPPSSEQPQSSEPAPRPELRSAPPPMPEPLRELLPPPPPRDSTPESTLPSAAGDRESADPPSTGGNPPKKPSKRPLPPYLRVVK